MEYMDKYPLISAESLDGNSRQENQFSYFLFNSQTNKGYSVDGLAALLCKQMNGKKKLRDLVKDLEAEYEIESGHFDKEIQTLMKDLSDNSLVIFNETPISE